MRSLPLFRKQQRQRSSDFSICNGGPYFQPGDGRGFQEKNELEHLIWERHLSGSLNEGVRFIVLSTIGSDER